MPAAERPILPKQLGPGERLTFNIVYRPTVPGPGNASIVINGPSGVAIPLRGVGLVPRAAVAISISPSGMLNPGEQARVSIALSGGGYPGVDLSGTLSLTIAPSNVTNSDDPATVFQNGSRSVTFTIPAGSPRAVFENGTTDFGLQNGTVAADVTLQAQFLTSGVNVTSAPAPELQAQVRRSAPVIREFAVEPSGASGFVLRATGFSSPREVTGVSIRLNANGVSKVSPEVYDVPNARNIFEQYYLTSAGRAAGSQFIFRLEVSFTGDRTAFRSFTITMTNPAGQSNSMDAAPP